MGLDNMVYLITKTPIHTDLMPEGFGEGDTWWFGMDCRENRDTGEPEYWYCIAYWRKCWGIRNDILEVLTDNGYCAEDNVNDYFTGDVCFLKLIEKVNRKYFDPDNWDDQTCYVWDWHELVHHLVNNSIAMLWAEELIKAWCNGDIKEFEGIQPFFKFRFVDSY